MSTGMRNSKHSKDEILKVFKSCVSNTVFIQKEEISNNEKLMSE